MIKVLVHYECFMDSAVNPKSDLAVLYGYIYMATNITKTSR